MAKCTHKTQANHAERSDSRLIWACTNCGLTSWWGRSWGYHGNYECTAGGNGYLRGCGHAQIDFVWCSKECRDALAAKHGVES